MLFALKTLKLPAFELSIVTVCCVIQCATASGDIVITTWAPSIAAKTLGTFCKAGSKGGNWKERYLVYVPKPIHWLVYYESDKKFKKESENGLKIGEHAKGTIDLNKIVTEKKPMFGKCQWENNGKLYEYGIKFTTKNKKERTWFLYTNVASEKDDSNDQKKCLGDYYELKKIIGDHVNNERKEEFTIESFDDQLTKMYKAIKQEVESNATHVFMQQQAESLFQQLYELKPTVQPKDYQSSNGAWVVEDLVDALQDMKQEPKILELDFEEYNISKKLREQFRKPMQEAMNIYLENFKNIIDKYRETKYSNVLNGLFQLISDYKLKKLKENECGDSDEKATLSGQAKQWYACFKNYLSKDNIKEIGISLPLGWYKQGERYVDGFSNERRHMPLKVSDVERIDITDIIKPIIDEFSRVALMKSLFKAGLTFKEDEELRKRIKAEKMVYVYNAEIEEYTSYSTSAEFFETHACSVFEKVTDCNDYTSNGKAQLLKHYALHAEAAMFNKNLYFAMTKKNKTTKGKTLVIISKRKVRRPVTVIA